MGFPTELEFSDNLANASSIANDVKAEIIKNQGFIATGEYPSDRLLALLTALKQRADALDSLKISLRFTSTEVGSLSADLTALIASIRGLLSWADTNLPKSGQFLLLFSLDVDFNVVPRVFTGSTLTMLDDKLTEILTEIS